MNPVILVSSCRRDQRLNYHGMIRFTWAKRSSIPVFFVLGKEGNKTSADEIVLDVGDDYRSLPWKTREGHRWALDQGFDFVFQCFTDTYCNPDRMLVSGFEQFDYVGHFRGEDQRVQLEALPPGCYASGGSGYWLNARSSKALLQSSIDHWAEDLWVGKVLGEAGICGTQDYRYWSAGGQMLPSNDAISVHLSRGTGEYDPRWMMDQHRVFRSSKLRPGARH